MLETCALSLLLFTVNLHNFSFSPAVPGSQERRTTARGLRLITGSVCKWSMKTASHKSNKNQSRGLGLFNGGYRTTQLRWTKGTFQKSELAGRTRHFQNEIGFFQEENHVLPAYYLVFEWSGWIVKSQILLTGREWSGRLTNTKRSKTKSSSKTVPIKVHCCIVFLYYKLT